MKYLPLAALLLSGCAAFNSTLDAQATAQNLANVSQVIAENDLAFEALGEVQSLKTIRQARNTEALGLAQKMAEAAK